MSCRLHNLYRHQGWTANLSVSCVSAGTRGLWPSGTVLGAASIDAVFCKVVTAQAVPGRSCPACLGITLACLGAHVFTIGTPDRATILCARNSPCAAGPNYNLSTCKPTLRCGPDCEVKREYFWAP